MKETIGKKYYTIKELAGLLGISRIAVFNKVKSKRIKAVMVGKTYLVPKQEISFLVGDELSGRLKEEITRAVKKVINEYGETLKLLGKE